jgi:hypothetical protein
VVKGEVYWQMPAATRGFACEAVSAADGNAVVAPPQITQIEVLPDAETGF